APAASCRIRLRWGSFMTFPPKNVEGQALLRSQLMDFNWNACQPLALALPLKLMGIRHVPSAAQGTNLHQVAHTQNGSMSLIGPSRHEPASEIASGFREQWKSVDDVRQSLFLDPIMDLIGARRSRTGRDEMRRRPNAPRFFRARFRKFRDCMAP